MPGNLVVAAAAAAVALTGAAAACGAPIRVSAPGTRLWVARFREDGSGGDSAMAVSPAGGRVFVAGESYGVPGTGIDYHTMAYSAATGRRLWASLYASPGRNGDEISAVAVSPDGGRVFVTGTTTDPGASGPAAATPPSPTLPPPAGSCGSATTAVPTP